MICTLCEETIADWTTCVAIGQELAHRECALRSVMGGIGHLTDHPHWCVEMHDPDGGMTYRQSALAADRWVTERAEMGA